VVGAWSNFLEPIVEMHARETRERGSACPI
jgi:hypothetical protein